MLCQYCHSSILRHLDTGPPHIQYLVSAPGDCPAGTHSAVLEELAGAASLAYSDLLPAAGLALTTLHAICFKDCNTQCWPPKDGMVGHIDCAQQLLTHPASSITLVSCLERCLAISRDRGCRTFPLSCSLRHIMPTDCNLWISSITCCAVMSPTQQRLAVESFATLRGV